MSVAIHGFQIDEPKGGVIFSLDDLNTTFAPWSSLFHRTWVLKEAVLIKPCVYIVRNAGGLLNLADLLLLDWPSKLRFRLNLMRLEDGKVVFRDAAVPGGFSTTFSRLTVTANDFSTSPDHDNSFSLSAVSESGETLSWGEIAAENVRISKYSPYFNERFDFTVADGTLTAHTAYDVDLARDRFTVLLRDGTIAARSLQVHERGSNAPLLGCAELALAGARVDVVRQTIKVASIVLTGGSAVLRRLPDNSFNVQHLMRPVRTFSVTKAAPSANWNVAAGEIRFADFAVEVNHVFGREAIEWKELRFSKPTFQMNPLAASIAAVTLRDGKLIFTDPFIQPPVRMALTHLDIRMGGFSSANPRLASVAVSAKIEDFAQLQISGESNPIRKHGETNVRGLLQNVTLVPLSPYAAKYLGYELTEGELSLDITFSIQRGKLNAKNKIDRLTFGGKTESRDATKLPVHLAIALLKDASGKITLNVPIEIALDDPTFEPQKAIIEAVLTPFRQTATSPFTALGAHVGGGGEELGFQEFSYGSAELDPWETGKLDTILQGLKRWPEFMLDIEGSVDTEKDTGDLRLLAARRANSVKEYLLRQGTMEPERIFLIDHSLEDVPRKGSRALLSLKDKFRDPF